MFRLIFFYLSIVHLLISQGLSLDPTKAYTNIPKLGGVHGYHKTSEKGRQYVAFEGIPYAQPPVGDLRFQVIRIPINNNKFYIFLNPN